MIDLIVRLLAWSPSLRWLNASALSAVEKRKKTGHPVEIGKKRGKRIRESASKTK
jgi:hypothetical protein